MTKRYYIAYGSNLNIDQMSYRCPGAKVVGTSKIPDFELLFKGSKKRSLPYHRAKERSQGSCGGMGGNG